MDLINKIWQENKEVHVEEDEEFANAIRISIDGLGFAWEFVRITNSDSTYDVLARTGRELRALGASEMPFHYYLRENITKKQWNNGLIKIMKLQNPLAGLGEFIDAAEQQYLEQMDGEIDPSELPEERLRHKKRERYEDPRQLTFSGIIV